MLPLLHPEDIDKDFVSGNKEFSIFFLFALVHMLLVCVFHLKSCVVVTHRYLMESTFSKTIPSKV